MLLNIKCGLKWLEQQPDCVLKLKRGIERESLRIELAGRMSQKPHPKGLGSAFTHKTITTDFAENLIEFVTPVDENGKNLIQYLKDLHKFSYENMGDELFWPFSMPCFMDAEDIKLAQYGSSNLAQYKTLYRLGLKNRYGAKMQTIAGIHYNFSFDQTYWEARFGKEKLQDAATKKQVLSERYFNLIRNYFRFGWIIPYLFGSSPALCKSFLVGNKNQSDYDFITAKKGYIYLPYATSLRLSDLGYTNSLQKNLDINYNYLDEYVKSLQAAVRTKCKLFEDLGAYDVVDGKKVYKQLNTYLLQNEAEFYSLIRPKSIAKNGETPSQSLAKNGVQYVEVRSLDTNPYSDVGISLEQIYFLDLFMLWCELGHAEHMDNTTFNFYKQNWNKVILEGRNPKLKLDFVDGSQKYLVDMGNSIFDDLENLAQILDSSTHKTNYVKICQNLRKAINNPELTISGRLLNDLETNGIKDFAFNQAQKFKRDFANNDYGFLTKDELNQMVKASVLKQKEIEQSDNMSFDDYLAQENNKF